MPSVFGRFRGFRTDLLAGLLGGLTSLWLCWSARAEPVAAPMAFAPTVPKPIARREPAHMVINLKTEEKVMDLSEGVQYEFWIYNGHVEAKSSH